MFASAAAGCIVTFGLVMVCSNFTTFTDHIPLKKVDYKTAKITSIVSLSIVIIVYIYFFFCCEQWMRLVIGLPKFISERMGTNTNVPVCEFYFLT